MTSKKWNEFEELVAKVQQDLSPADNIQTNVKIKGKSGRKRQVDVAIRATVANIPILVAIECKDYKKPVDVKSVEETMGLFQDIKAHVGIIVAAKGFTKTALKRGDDAGLKLYKLIDTGEHAWKCDIALPAICHVQNLKKSQFMITFLSNCRYKYAFPDDLNIIYDENQQPIGTLSEILLSWWDIQSDTINEGYHSSLEITKQALFLPSEEGFSKIKVVANIFIEDLIFFRYWPTNEMSGFEDQTNKGAVETRGFTLETIDIYTLQKKWQRIFSREEIAVTPVIKLSIKAMSNFDE